MQPPNPRPEATVCAVTRVTLRNWPQPPLSRYSLFWLSLQTMGCREERCDGGRTLLRTHDEKLRLGEKNRAKHFQPSETKTRHLNYGQYPNPVVDALQRHVAHQRRFPRSRPGFRELVPDKAWRNVSRCRADQGSPFDLLLREAPQPFHARAFQLRGRRRKVSFTA